MVDSALQARRNRRRKSPRARLTEPLVRNASGELEPTTWDNALSVAAAGLDTARVRGPEAVGMFSCSKATNELNYASQKFMRAVLGSNNIDSCNRT